MKLNLSNYRNIAAFFMCLTLSNCSGKKEFYSLSPNIQKEVKSCDVEFEEEQDEFCNKIHKANLSRIDGGLIFALIDVAVESYREGKAKELSKNLEKFCDHSEFNKKFKESVIKALKDSNWINIHTIEHKKKSNEDKKIDRKYSSDALINIKFSYATDKVFDAILGTLHFTMTPNSERLKKIANHDPKNPLPVLKFNVKSRYRLPNADNDEDKEKNIAMWVANDGLLLKKALDYIIKEIIKKTSSVLENPDALPEK